ncbi:MAG TPA: HPF/RaiA family ribosome-associated protein [Chthoniobacterales bacterium]
MTPKLALQFRIRHIHPPAARKTTALLREHLVSLARLRQIDAAHLSLEREPETSAFRVSAHLVTPGPDIRAEGRDRTLYAAALRVLTQLQRQIRARNARRRERLADRAGHPRVSMQRNASAYAG